MKMHQNVAFKISKFSGEGHTPIPHPVGGSVPLHCLLVPLQLAVAGNAADCHENAAEKL